MLPTVSTRNSCTDFRKNLMHITQIQNRISLLYRFSVQHRQLQQWLKISLPKVIFDTIMSDFINLYKLFVITRFVLKGSLYNNLLEFG